MIELIRDAARLSGQRLARARIENVTEALKRSEKAPPAMRFIGAWRAAGLIGQPVPLRKPTQADLPLLRWTETEGFALLTELGTDGRFSGRTEEGAAVSVAVDEPAMFLRLTTREEVAATPRAIALVAKAVWERKVVLFEAALATFVVSLLALGISLYSMQVYDRVIPNQGYQTLWVLTAGVAMAIFLEWLLKQVRAYIVDRAGVEMDKSLSQWFFDRMQHVRMDARPTTVGTLAAQVKGFETVRAMFTSTSMYVLADVPFALFFLFVIALIGGSVVIVPLVALPLALFAGLMFQRALRRHATRMTVSSYRKNGLLVEAVEGGESIRAMHGEWHLSSRWQTLVAEVAEADEHIKMLSAWSQNLTALLQQASYVSLIAAGAYMVANNQLTMGGLLAISIISNRAMTPIVQLPGILVQWAHARAALDGLDQIIFLANDEDGLSERMTPQTLEPSVRVHQVRFSYGLQQTVLEIESLSIAAGEKVGLIGPVGSGKSTMFKIASGLFRPQEGKVFIGGMDVSLLHPAVVRETVGYLPQDMRLVSGTLRQNLILGLPDPGDEAILEASKQTGLFELIGRHPKGVGLEISEGGRGVSGGQKQMIALTRLLLAKPRLWLLDEPTASMDSESEARVINLMKARLDATDTLIVATHKTAFLPMLTRLIVIRDGKVVFDGPRDTVLAALQGRQPVPAGQRPTGATA
jgi:ATP-binding cassette subfamily C protein LapB